MPNNTDIGYIICESEGIPSATIETKNLNGKAIATCILQTANEKNRNGRFYSSEELFPQLTAPRTLELLQKGYLRAEDGHPMDKDLQRQSTIWNPNTCARFLNLWTEGDNIMARAVGTNNELGRSFNADLKDGQKPSFSLRALGSVDRERNGKCYVRNIRCITYDTVVYPSHKKAYMTGFVTPTNESAITESANIDNIGNYTNSTTMFENGIVIPIVNQQVVDYIKQESTNVKDILNNFDTLYESAIIVNDGKKVQLTLPGGDKILVNLEQYIADEIRNYCWNG